jgi:Fic family protein
MQLIKYIYGMKEGGDIISLIKRYRELNLSDIMYHDKFLYYALTFHSTAIEGSTLTEVETRLLLDEGITPGGKPLEHSQMAKDHYDALRFTLEHAQSNILLSAALVQQINAHVMKTTGSIYNTVLGDIDAAKGEYRKGNVSAGGHYFVGYDKVLSLTKQLAEAIQTQLERAITLEEKLQLAFKIHYELVTIHPFYDGNGRTSRLFMNFILERCKLPLCIVYQEDKARYYEVLAKGQQQGDQQPFFAFMSQQYQKQLKEEIRRAEALLPEPPKQGRSL